MRSIRVCLMAACVASMLLDGGVAQAEGEEEAYKPALVYLYAEDESDSAFIKSARSGVARAEHDFHVPVDIIHIRSNEMTAPTIKKLAEEGKTPIILLGNQNVEPVLNLAPHYPDIKFTVIDGLVPPLTMNVQSVLFKDQEGAFLIGYLAAKMTHSGIIGFVGGMDSTTIRNFATGYEQGAHYADAKVQVLSQMVGETSEAWSSPDKAEKIALEQYHNGADIVFGAAGGSSVGVLKAANESGKLAVGVDSNQNGLYPGRVLTSMVKRVDVAIYNSLKDSQDGSWKPGISYLGIKESALDYSVDQNNRGLMSGEVIEDLANVKDKIVNGKIVIESHAVK